MTPSHFVDSLSRLSRAYNALYGAGLATPENVSSLSSEDVNRILDVAAEVERGEGTTDLHKKMRAMNPALLRYVVGGGL